MSSNEEELLTALIRKRPNTQPSQLRSSQIGSRSVSQDTSNVPHIRSVSGAPGEREDRMTPFGEDGYNDQSARTSVEPVDKSISTPSSQLTTGPLDEDFNFTFSQYQPQMTLKRKFSEDLTNFAEEQARLYGLHGIDAEEVTQRFAHYTLEQKLIALYAFHKRQKIDVEKMYAAASGPWAPSSTLLNKIRKFAFLVLINPALPSYIGDRPLQMVMNVLRRYPRMGFTAEIAADAAKQASVEKAVSEQLTVVRNEFKTIIHKFTSDEAQPRKDIQSLCRAVFAAKAKLAPRLQLTISIACRFAFLRGVFLINSGHRYWNKVDKALESMRNQYEQDEITECFTATLDEDRILYPPSDGDNGVAELPFSNFSVEDHIDESESVIGSF